MSRRHNPCLVHVHRCYDSLELARTMRVSEGTIRRWTKLGLEPIDRKRPYLFHGARIREFLEALNPPRCPLTDGKIYCTPCRGPRRSEGGIVTLEPKTPTSANFVGYCPDCGRPMNRRVRYVDIPHKLGDLRIRYEDEQAPVSSDGERLEVTLSREVSL